MNSCLLKQLSDQEARLCQKCYDLHGQSCIQGWDKPDLPEDTLHHCEILKREVIIENSNKAANVALSALEETAQEAVQYCADLLNKEIKFQSLIAQPNGSVELKIKPPQKAIEIIANAFYDVVKDVPNYVETQFTVSPDDKNPTEILTVTVRREEGMTPGQRATLLKEQLDEVMKYAKHYATLLNYQDGGKRDPELILKNWGKSDPCETLKDH